MDSGIKARRKAIASLGASTMHARDPDAARRNGIMGGRTTADGYLDGKSAWGKRMALARWHGTPFDYVHGYEPKLQRQPRDHRRTVPKSRVKLQSDETARGGGKRYTHSLSEAACIKELYWPDLLNENDPTK
jgi:hypothetical protein